MPDFPGQRIVVRGAADFDPFLRPIKWRWRHCQMAGLGKAIADSAICGSTQKLCGKRRARRAIGLCPADAEAPAACGRQYDVFAHGPASPDSTASGTSIIRLIATSRNHRPDRASASSLARLGARHSRRQPNVNTTSNSPVEMTVWTRRSPKHVKFSSILGHPDGTKSGSVNNSSTYR